MRALGGLGYPDSRDKVFSSPEAHFPEVVLTEGGKFEDISIHLPAPDGILQATVIDKSTNTPIPSARVTLRWVADPTVFMSENVPRSGGLQYALPTRPITLSVSAPGYRTWVYTKPDTHDQFIELHSIDHISLRIEMERADSGS